MLFKTFFLLFVSSAFLGFKQNPFFFFGGGWGVGGSKVSTSLVCNSADDDFINNNSRCYSAFLSKRWPTHPLINFRILMI